MPELVRGPVPDGVANREVLDSSALEKLSYCHNKGIAGAMSTIRSFHEGFPDRPDPSGLPDWVPPLLNECCQIPDHSMGRTLDDEQSCRGLAKHAPVSGKVLPSSALRRPKTGKLMILVEFTPQLHDAWQITSLGETDPDPAANCRDLLHAVCVTYQSF